MNQLDFDALKASKVFIDAFREVEGTRLSSRRAILKQIAELEAASARELKRLGMAEGELATEIERLTQQSKALGYRLGAIRGEIMQRGEDDTRARRRLEAQLRAEADPRIFRFIVWAQRALNLVQYASAHQTLAWEGSAISEAATFNESASAAAHRASTVIQHQIERAEGMLMLAIPEADLTNQLDAMADEVVQAYNSVPNVRSHPADYKAVIQ